MKIIAERVQVTQPQSTDDRTASRLKKAINHFRQLQMEPFPAHVWHRAVIRDHLRTYADRSLLTRQFNDCLKAESRIGLPQGCGYFICGQSPLREAFPRCVI